MNLKKEAEIRDEKKNQEIQRDQIKVLLEAITRKYEQKRDEVEEDKKDNE